MLYYRSIREDNWAEIIIVSFAVQIDELNDEKTVGLAGGGLATLFSDGRPLSTSLKLVCTFIFNISLYTVSIQLLPGGVSARRLG